MSTQPSETQFRPAVLRDALRHHVLLILILVILFGAAGAAAGLLLPGPRQATAVVLVNPLYGNPFSTDSQGDQLSNLSTEAQLVATDAVAGIAQKKLTGDVAISNLVRSVRGAVTENTQVLKITYTAKSAKAAHDRAQAFAEAYLTYRQDRAKALVAGQVALLQQQQTTFKAQQSKANADAARAKDGSAARSLATEQVKTYSAQLTQLTSEIAQEQAIPTDPGQVISPASTPDDVKISSAILYGLIGVIAGLVLGILAAITRERLDDRIRDTSDFDRLSVTSLGQMALPSAWSPSLSEVTEDHRRVRTALLTMLPSVPATIVIGRPDSSGVAPTIVGPIALALARSGVRVCVVDSAVTDWLGQELVPNTNQGLASVLLQDVPVESTLRQPVPGLGVVPRGRWNSEAADQLGNVRMRRAIAQLRKYFDIVIISTPSMQNADGQVLSRMADGVVLESSVMNTTNGDLLRTVEQLDRAHVPVLGSVLVSRGPSRRLRRRRSAASATSQPAQAPAFESKPVQRESPPTVANQLGPRSAPASPSAAIPASQLSPRPEAQSQGVAANGSNGTNGHQVEDLLPGSGSVQR